MSLLMKILTMLTGVYVLFTPLFIHSRMDSSPCRGIEITIADSARHRFVNRDDIMNLVRSTGIRVRGIPVNEISIAGIEEKIKTLKELRVAEVYFSADNMMHIYADQREPVMRVIATYGGDFFIDTEGVIMRRHNIYTPRLHVFEIDMVFSPNTMTGTSIFENEKTENLARAFELVNYIKSDTFWSAMIDHLYMARDGEVEMVPRVGNHVIHLGKVESYQEKFDKLFVFYREAMPKAGWDRYKSVNIEYKGQVVCQRR
jgi:cell division protein FtsQ